MGRTPFKFRVVLYGWLAVLGALSFLGAWLLPVSEVVSSIIALPFVGALFTVLFQLIRDYTTFEHDRIKQEREHAFLVSATSHWSAVVFDKHVEFSEKYVKAMQDLLGKLLAEGPSKVTFGYLGPLREVRRDYLLWISPSVAGALDEFESKIMRMGMSLASKASEDELDKTFELFYEIMNMKPEERDTVRVESQKRRGYVLVIEHLQRILGIEKLTQLRDSVLSSPHNVGATHKK